jgi:hypothetical protein
MVRARLKIPSGRELCIKNCIQFTGKDSNHQGFGGLDSALAMVAALEQAETLFKPTYDKLCLLLGRLSR